MLVDGIALVVPWRQGPTHGTVRDLPKRV